MTKLKKRILKWMWEHPTLSTVGHVVVGLTLGFFITNNLSGEIIALIFLLLIPCIILLLYKINATKKELEIAERKERLKYF